jgi:hypothetical protein
LTSSTFLRAGVVLATLLLGVTAGQVSQKAQAAPGLVPSAVVTNVADSGAGSLRYVVTNAAVGATVTFTVTGVITLTSGDIGISKNLTIQGPGAGTLAINADHASGIFNIQSGSVVTISGLTIENGSSSNGGAVYNNGSLTVDSSTLVNNVVSGSGGAIFNDNVLTLTNSSLISNSAELMGGGLYNQTGDRIRVVNTVVNSNTTPGSGGGYYNAGIAVAISTTLQGNNATGTGGGVYNAADSVLTLSANTFVNNSGPNGGAIANAGVSNVDSSTFATNTTSTNGGGIFNTNTLLVTNSRFGGNTAPDHEGGAIYNLGGGVTVQNGTFVTNTAVRGGAISNNAAITITGGVFDNNGGSETFGGGGFYNQGTAAISGTAFVRNVAGPGAGVLNTTALSLDNVTFTGNTSLSSGAGLYNIGVMTVTGGLFNGNVAASNGGGAYNTSGGVLAVQKVSFITNTAPIGGAISNDSSLTVTESTFDGNIASAGGGGLFSSGSATVISSTLIRNEGGNGGAFLSSGSLLVDSSTLVSNTVSGAGAGIFSTNILTLTYSTLVSNTTPNSGAGVYNAGSATFKGTILANELVTPVCGFGVQMAACLLHTNAVQSVTATPDNCAGNAITSDGYNLTSDAACGFSGTGNVNNTFPLLGPLQDNGGSTQTMLPLPGSPAIDAGGAVCPVVDQRGMGRVGACDIGAAEVQGYQFSISGGAVQSATVGLPFSQPLVVSVTDMLGAPVDGGQVTFSAPPSGASTNPAERVVDIAQSYASDAATANGTGGTYSVTAHASGVAVPVAFTLTNLVPAVTITATPDLLWANGISNSLVTVRLMSAGQPVVGYTVTVSAQGGQLSPGTPFTTQTDANGYITTTYTVSNTPGTGIVTTTLTPAPAISETAHITLIAPPTTLVGELTSKFGSDITYTWVVTNVGTFPLFHVTITSEVPANTHVVTGSVVGGILVGMNVVSTTETLTVGEVISITYAVHVDRFSSPIVAHATAVGDNGAVDGVKTNTVYLLLLPRVMRQ